MREARKAEQDKDTIEFEGLLATRRKLVRDAQGWLDHLNCPPGILDDFEKKHNSPQPNPDTVTDSQIRALKVDLEELEKAIGRLEARATSDGLFVALRNVMSANVWKPKVLANMIIKVSGRRTLHTSRPMAPASMDTAISPKAFQQVSLHTPPASHHPVTPRFIPPPRRLAGTGSAQGG